MGGNKSRAAAPLWQPSAALVEATGADVVATTALRNMAQLSVLLQGKFTRMAKPFDIPSVAALNVLERLLESDGPMSPTALALAASVTPGAMSQLLQTLERRKFIRRHVEPEDRRKLSVQLTPLGRRRTQACRVEANRLEARICGGLTSRQLAELIDLVALLQRDAIADD